MGIRPFQAVCLLGGFVCATLGLTLREDIIVELIVAAMAFVFVMVCETLLRGMAAGALPFKGTLISQTESPGSYMFAFFFYVATLVAMLYFSVDLLWLE